MSFYQKYRPRKVAELDLASVREVLSAALESGKISHAYLFVGPRGSGKTSAARILAQAVNCEKNKGKKDGLFEPCGKCVSCSAIVAGSGVDVVEIDAASNGLVDDIRDLREKVRLLPVHLEKKIYIIDEVHMVSTAGFNALLKTLEEPPAHVLFVLCTTEAQKIPETIASRCVRVNFVKATEEEVIRSLMKAVEGEGLTVASDVLARIAEFTDGSFREGHKLLEQLSVHGKKIELDMVERILGVANLVVVKRILELVEVGNVAELVTIFGGLEKSGVRAQPLVSLLIIEAKRVLESSLKVGRSVDMMVKIIDGLIVAADRIKMSPLPLLPIEMALLTVALHSGGGESNGDKKTGRVVMSDAVVGTTSKSLTDEGNKSDQGNAVIQHDSPMMIDLDTVKMGWGRFLESMAECNGSLAGMLRLVSPVEVSGKSLTLSVTSRFQQDMLEREVKRRLIEAEMAKVWGPLTFKCVLVDKQIRTMPDSEDDNLVASKEDIVSHVSVMTAAEKIFGG